MKIWKFNENWKISYLYSEMKFPISYLSLRLKYSFFDVVPFENDQAQVQPGFKQKLR